MKTTRKNFLGLLGLFVVAAVTTFAVFLPQPGASAADVQSVTDEITVRVVGETPMVKFTSPEDGTRFTEPNQTITYDYENVTDVTVSLEYTNLEGEKQTGESLKTGSYDYNPGSDNITLDLDDYGYGDYKVTVKGNGYGSGNVAEDVIEFHYNVIAGGVTKDEATGNPVVDPGVHHEDPHVKRVEVRVFTSPNGEGDMNGERLDRFTREVWAPYDSVMLQFRDAGLSNGWYRIEIWAHDESGATVGGAQNFWFYWDNGLAVPDTGGSFGGLNISRQDYLLSGLIIFGAAALLGIVLVVRRKATAKKK